MVKGFVHCKLRKREAKEIIDPYEHQIALEDYYSFYFTEPLKKLNHITISKLLQIDSVLFQLMYEIYKRKISANNIQRTEAYIKTYLPKIKENAIRAYLEVATIFSKPEIDIYLKIVTAQNNGKIDLYATPLVKFDNYYYFNLYSAVHRNSYFLVDYWLELAEESLDKRGYALEVHLKKELKKIKLKQHNVFKVIEKSDFVVNSQDKEEIDLIIQTKDSLIVAEVKCVKYPMYERDHYSVTEVITKAVKQIIRKTNFLIKNQSYFKDVYSIENKTIYKMVILNYPVYTGIEIEGVPVTDVHTFASYFQSDKMSVWESGNDSREKIGEFSYYNSEEEFCKNLYDYLINNPQVNYHRERLIVSESSYKLDGWPEVIYTDIKPKSHESILMNDK